jgi:hypothetical protein
MGAVPMPTGVMKRSLCPSLRVVRVTFASFKHLAVHFLRGEYNRQQKRYTEQETTSARCPFGQATFTSLLV